MGENLEETKGKPLEDLGSKDSILENSTESVMEKLEKEVLENMLYPKICLQELKDVLPEELVAYHITKGTQLSEEGAYTWQEVAVLTSTALVLWFSEDNSAQVQEKSGIMMHTQVKVVPLRECTATSSQSYYDKEGNYKGISTMIMLKSLDALEKHDCDEEDCGVSFAHEETISFTAKTTDEKELKSCIKFSQAFTKAVLS